MVMVVLSINIKENIILKNHNNNNSNSDHNSNSNSDNTCFHRYFM